MTQPDLEFTDIKGGYSDAQIIRGISGVVQKGDVLGIFGRNGVGKTTLAKLIIGALPVTSGSIFFNAENISGLSSHARRRRGIGYMPQTEMVFDSLTVRENLLLAKTKRSLEPYLEAFPRLKERTDQLAGSMSGGERKILSFVRTMLEDTSTIVLDEPSEGVQPENILKMQCCIEVRKSEGTSFLLIEQNLNMLTDVADNFLGIESGSVVFEGEKASTKREHLIALLTV